MKQSEEVHLSLAGLDQQKTFIVEIFPVSRKKSLATQKSRKNSQKIVEMYRTKFCEKKMRSKLKKTIEDSKDLFTEIGEEIKVQSKKREELNQQHKDFLRTKRRTCEACVRS